MEVVPPLHALIRSLLVLYSTELYGAALIAFVPLATVIGWWAIGYFVVITGLYATASTSRVRQARRHDADTCDHDSPCSA
jgi:hypothetical protein